MPREISGLVGLAGVMCLAPVLWAVSNKTLPDGVLLTRSRDFYGMLSVWDVKSDKGKSLLLHHGGISHGHQFRRESLRATPTTYYHEDSGVGLVLGARSPLPTPRRVGVVGLGAGTVAAFARAGDVYRFYEIAPNVARLAEQPFTYLADLRLRGAHVDVVLGDGRLSLQRETGSQRFDALVLDAFSGDAIPVHMLTVEAFAVYERHLSPSGVICVHVSSNYLDLYTVVAAAARRIGWSAIAVDTPLDAPAIRFPARWVLISPDPARLEPFKAMGAIPVPERPGFTAWTDEHASLLPILQ